MKIQTDTRAAPYPQLSGAGSAAADKQAGKGAAKAAPAVGDGLQQLLQALTGAGKSNKGDLKASSFCHACGKKGHWRHDKECNPADVQAKTMRDAAAKLRGVEHRPSDTARPRQRTIASHGHAVHGGGMPITPAAATHSYLQQPYYSTVTGGPSWGTYGVPLATAYWPGPQQQPGAAAAVANWSNQQPPSLPVTYVAQAAGGSATQPAAPTGPPGSGGN
jgi:hypothetical protein